MSDKKLELKENMYVRTRLGIGKIITVGIDNAEIDFFNNSIVLPICNTNFLKASYNIIDLIEVGDYVNGYIVCKIDEDRKYFCLNYNYDFEFDNSEIETIVTKEQFESILYKVD